MSGGAVPTLAVLVSPPAHHNAAFEHGTESTWAPSTPSTKQLHNRPGDADYVDRGETIGTSGTVTDLPDVVLPPAPHTASLERGACTVGGGRDTTHHTGGEAGNRDRGVSVCGGVVPELAVIVSPPAHHRAVTKQRNGVIVARIQGRHRPSGDTDNRGGAQSVHVGAITDQAIEIRAPAHHRAVRPDGTGDRSCKAHDGCGRRRAGRRGRRRRRVRNRVCQQRPVGCVPHHGTGVP